jgi:hypothetical protein
MLAPGVADPDGDRSEPNFCPRLGAQYGRRVGALIMLGTLIGLIALVFGVVLRYDPEARRPSTGEGSD